MLKARNNSTCRDAIPPKYINVIYEFCLARQKHDVWIAAVPESCSTAELVELNWVPNLIQKFDSDAVLLPCFCRTSFLNLVGHGRSTTSELGLRHEWVGSYALWFVYCSVLYFFTYIYHIKLGHSVRRRNILIVVLQLINKHFNPGHKNFKRDAVCNYETLPRNYRFWYIWI